MDDYVELLRRAKKSLPERKESTRFEIPVVVIYTTSKETTIKNFSDIAKMLRREPKQIAKYLFKELATPGSIQNNELRLQSKLNAQIINSRIMEYAKDFVYCQECKKPDTNLTTDGKIVIMKCEACGARRMLKGV
ncbi:MAG: translation initiation factor IF-2 subunit beta [Candidatus Aenigmarchaeota archaeon]|nr:translation initiation factor IF-2 subunit beta [Candidatus Aenigmarchaeota archaeon]